MFGNVVSFCAITFFNPTFEPFLSKEVIFCIHILQVIFLCCVGIIIMLNLYTVWLEQDPYWSSVSDYAGSICSFGICGGKAV